MTETALEFLVITSDYALLLSMTSAIQGLGGRLHTVSSVQAAFEPVERRKIDGIVLDMALERSLELVKMIRTGRSNRHAVIFACASERAEAGAIVTAGANFVFYKPLATETLHQIFSAALPTMISERKRYFRYKIIVPVNLSCSGTPHRAVISNLSETGMAIRSTQDFAPGTPVDFSFELPLGPLIKGRGEIVWSNTAGSIGVKFHFLSDTGHRELPQWLERRAGK